MDNLQNGQTVAEGEPDQVPTTEAGDPEGGTPTQPQSVKVKVYGEEREVRLDDPALATYLSKGLAYDRKVEEQSKSIETEVQKRIDEMRQKELADRDQEQFDQRVRQVAEVDPVEAEVLKSQREISDLRVRDEKREQELKQLRWDQQQETVFSRHPDFNDVHRERTLARMLNKGIDLNAAAVEIKAELETDTSSLEEKIRQDIMDELKQNVTKNPPPAGNGGEGAPINPGERKFTDVKSPDFKSAVTEELARRMGE